MQDLYHQQYGIALPSQVSDWLREQEVDPCPVLHLKFSNFPESCVRLNYRICLRSRRGRKITTKSMHIPVIRNKGPLPSP